jgi:uncharacterized protein YbjQ (UPF0145 family)
VTAHRANMKERMRRLARAAIAESMGNAASWRWEKAAAELVKDHREKAADAIVDLIWDWFEIRERKRKQRRTGH